MCPTVCHRYYQLETFSHSLISLISRPRRELAAKPAQGKAAATTTTAASRRRKEEKVEIEYVTAPLDVVLAEAMPSGAGGGGGDGGGEADNGQALEEFQRILQRFNGIDESEIAAADQDMNRAGGGGDGAAPMGTEKDADGAKKAKKAAADGASSGDDEDDNDNDDNENDTSEAALSKRKRKEAARLKIAELKQVSERPEVVEVWDVTAADPALLVYLKSYRNTVPVPRHWSQKRKYLQGKRGLEKPPFQLPAFIEATGIGEMRQAYLEKADSKSMKSKGRERMAPKMGKLDIDYQILHDAFFRHQTKPALTGHGDLYYEGKEYEASIRHARPGVLSQELQTALEMLPGAPPPWLIAMQRYGPPPSYPSLRIPGLNAPIPAGAHFGYHTGGWGKPPVDGYGTPIYGDVFNQGLDGAGDDEESGPVGVRHWGELQEEESEEEESDEEEESEDEEDGSESDEEGGGDAAAFADGTASTMSGLASSIPGGLETPVEVQLRKAAEQHAAAAPEAPKQLYQVLEQQKTGVGATGIMGSSHVYVVPGGDGGGGSIEKSGGVSTGAIGGGEKKVVSLAAAKRLEALRREMPSDVAISIDPGDLEALDDDSLKDLYEQRVREARQAAGREDFSDLVAAKAVASQKRKGGDGGQGKEKKFKF